MLERALTQLFPLRLRRRRWRRGFAAARRKDKILAPNFGFGAIFLIFLDANEDDEDDEYEDDEDDEDDEGEDDRGRRQGQLCPADEEDTEQPYVRHLVPLSARTWSAAMTKDKATVSWTRTEPEFLYFRVHG